MEELFWSLIKTDVTYDFQYALGEIHIYSDSLMSNGQIGTGARIVITDTLKNILAMGWFPSRLLKGEDYEEDSRTNRTNNHRNV